MPGYLVRSAHPRARGYGGQAVRPRQPDGAAQAHATARWEALLFEGYRDQRVALEIVCFDGIVIQGYLRAWERYSLLVDTPEGEVLVMKHGVIRVGPRRVRSASPVGSAARTAVRDVKNG